MGVRTPARPRDDRPGREAGARPLGGGPHWRTEERIVTRRAVAATKGWAVRLNTARLRREMARRGLSGADLATLAGLSPTTISTAKHGRPVSPRTLRKIAFALSRAPALPGGEDLLLEADGPRAQ